ncbi:MAG: hypothetical protein IJ318_01130, partial [Clostridia bacterium]|nr:hypothetical protein [Clostridia bacterium]
ITVGDDTWYSLTGVNMNNVDYKGKTFWFIQKYVTAGGYRNSTSSLITGQVFDADWSNDYDQSDIYTYLSETGAYISTAVTGIADSDLYGKITERSVSETYTVNYADEPQENIFSSKLWLINQAELGLLNGSAVNNYNTNVGISYGIGNTAGFDGQGANWWLRSPLAGYADSAQYIDPNGYFNEYSTEDLKGVRAAFEITIPA